MMGKLIKLILGGTVLLGLLFGVVVFGVILFFDPNAHKDRIITRLEEETGRQFALEGDINLGYYPWLGLEVSGVTVGNAEGFGNAPFMRADVLALRIKTLSLLNGLYELDTLRLYGVEINLARNKAGVSNWDDLVGGEKDGVQKQEPTKLVAVMLGGVDIKNTRFTWVDEVSGQTFRISDMNMSTGELKFGEPIDIKMNLKAESTQPAVKADLQMQGTASYDLDAKIYAFNPIEVTAKLAGENVPADKADVKFNTGIVFNQEEDTVSIDDLTLGILGTLVKARLDVSNVQSGKPKIEGQLSVVGDDLSRLFKLLGEEALTRQIYQLQEPSFDMRITLNADLEKGNVAITDLKAGLIGAVISGRIEASNIESDKPAVQGELKASGPDLSALLQVAGQFETGDDPQLKTFGAKLSSAPNKGFDVNTGFVADFSSGNINIPTLMVKTLGLTVNGQLQAKDISSSDGDIDGKLSIQGENFSSVLAALEQDGLAKNLSTISADVVIQGNRSDIKLSPLKAEAFFSGKQVPDSPAKVTLDADTQISLDKQTLSIAKMAVTGPGLDVKGDLNVTGFLSGTPGAKGKIDAKGEDLGLIFRLFGDEPLAQQVNRLKDKSFSVRTDFDADMETGSINLPSLSANGLGLTVDGKIVATDFNNKGKGNVNGQLALKGDDLSAVLLAFDQGTLAEVLKKITVDIGIKGTSDDINLNPLNVKATFSGKDIPNSPADLVMTADTKVNLDKQTLSMRNMEVNGLGLNLKANVSAAQIKDKPAFSGDIAVTEFNFRKFMTQMKQELPFTADRQALTKVAVDTKFSGSTNNIEFKDLVLLLDDSTLAGDLSIKNFTRPRIKFGIDIDGVNVDHYLPPVAKSEAQTGAPKTAKNEASSGTPEASTAAELPVDMLRKLNAKGKLQVGNLIYSNLKLENIKLDVNAEEGLIKTVTPIIIDLYQGKYQGNITLDAREKLAQLNHDMQLMGVHIEPLVMDYTRSPASKFAGIANITADISSRGVNLVQFKNELNGQARLEIEDGVLRVIDIKNMLSRAEALLGNKVLDGTVDSSEETRFEQLSGTLNITNGIVKNDDLLIAAPGFVVSGGVDGKDTLANLRNNTIEYDLSVEVARATVSRGGKTHNTGGYAVPVRCQGSLNDIAAGCRPDYGRLLGTAVKKGVRRKLQDVIGIKLPGSEQTTQESATNTESTQPRDATAQPTREPVDPVEEFRDRAIKGALDKLF